MPTTTEKKVPRNISMALTRLHKQLDVLINRRNALEQDIVQIQSAIAALQV